MSREVWNHPGNKNNTISMHYKLKAAMKFTETCNYAIHLHRNVIRK
jgi:hypothetical protein